MTNAFIDYSPYVISPLFNLGPVGWEFEYIEKITNQEGRLQSGDLKRTN